MPQAGTEAPQKRERLLKGRDLINIGVFFALYFILTMIPMVLSGIHPMIWVLFPGLAAIVGSIPYLLLCARVQKPFAVLIMGVLMALICASTGYFTIALVLTICSSLAAEIVRWRTGDWFYGGYAASFVLFSFVWLASPLPIWLYHDSFMAQIQNQGMSAEYVAACAQVSEPPFMVVCITFAIVGALIGALVTRKLFKKHFAKAGLA